MRQVLRAGVVLAFLLAGLQVLQGAEPTGESATRRAEKPYGLGPRLPLTTSQVYGSPEPPLPYRATPAFGDKKFNQPVYLFAEPGSQRLLIVDYTGKILSIPDPSVIDTTTPPPTIVDKPAEKVAAPEVKPEASKADATKPAEAKAEFAKADVLLEQTGRMLYSITFHPKYEENRYLYLFSNGVVKGQGPSRKNRLTRFTVSKTAPYACDPKSELIIIEWNSNGHDGGDMAFGKDGYLYMTAGDGTTDSDTNVTGQDITDLNSGLLRLDVDHPEPGKNYAIPSDNPFLKIEKARHELWAFGFRNPWRLHIDPQGNIWCGDVGQDLWEMIEVVQRGDNYGWSVWEGGHPFYLERKIGPAPLKAPAIAHPHSEARSITGGVTYLGKKFPELYGHYIYGDYATGKIWACRYQNGKIVQHREIADTPNQIATFGIDHSGEIYFSDYGVMKFFTLERTPKETVPHTFPRKLSDTGLFASVAGHRVQAPLIPYSVNSPLWSDGAYKERFMALPGKSKIEFDEKGAWKFPEKSVLVKSFALEREPGNPATRTWIETRFMVFQQKEWVGYSYRWNDEQNDAVLVGTLGEDRPFTIHDPSAPGKQRVQTWHFPSRAECMVCHSRAAGFILGPHTLQMNKLHDYGGVVDNQIRALVHSGALSIPVSEHIRFYDERQKREAERLKAVWKPQEDSQPLLKLLENNLPGRFTRLVSTVLTPSRRFWNRAVAIAAKVVRESRERSTSSSMLELTYSSKFYPALSNPLDSKLPLESRVKSYLHVNCAVCHVDAGGGNAAMWLGYHTPLAEMRILDAIPLHDKFGVPDAKIIAPGAPQRSVLLQRISQRGRGKMPPLASSVVDAEGVALMEMWIRQLPPSQRSPVPKTDVPVEKPAASRRSARKSP